MTDPLTTLHDSADVRQLLRRVDTARLARDLGVPHTAEQEKEAIPALRIAASLALAESLADEQVDDLLRSMAAERDATEVSSGARAAFQKWVGYVYALLDIGDMPTIDELFLFVSAGLLARQPVEVR